MDLDNYLNNLNTDLERQMAELNNSFGSIMGTNTAAVPSSQEQQSEEVQEFMFCPECGTKLAADSKFCSNCGTKLDGDVRDERESDNICFETSNNNYLGVIMTDTKVLATKYDIARVNVRNCINSFVKKCEDYDIKWFVLDMADRETELGESTWMDYSEVLQKFMISKKIKPSPKVSLFIIGGNDVIPQPAESNPCGDPEDDYQDTVYADFYYCFYGELPLDFLDFNKARCNVARLPMESGQVESDFESDVQEYLDRCISTFDNGGISIGNAMMLSNVDWIPASREMSRNLPMPHIENIENETLDNMFLSPNVMADFEEMDEDLSNKYYGAIRSADMLMFNLHGACRPKDSSFYSHGEAFSIETLNYTSASLFNTVACWGGRYIKYDREHSMLLNAIYGRKVMLYSGSCVPALGKCGNFQHDSTWRIQPAAYSETFMARFANYECIGTIAAGEAFLKAKCDYYNSSRSIEEDECTLGTVLMFNLYGCPFLRTIPDEDSIEEMQAPDGSKAMRIPFRRMNRQTVMKNPTNAETGTKSLLDEIRGAVDNNLSAIHEAIKADLYDKLNLEPRDLFCVERYSTEDIYGRPEKGYLYNYKKRDKVISSTVRVKVDENGHIRDAIQTK